MAPVPHPDADADWLNMTLANNANLLRWLDDRALMTWLDGSRLDLLGHLRPRTTANPEAHQAAVAPIRSRLTTVNAKLESLLRN